MNKRNIKITANSLEEFKNIEDKLNKLPENVSMQIQSAENGLIGLVCDIKSIDGDIYLPNDVKSIIESDDYFGIVGGDDCYFKIAKDYKIKFRFTDH